MSGLNIPTGTRLLGPYDVDFSEGNKSRNIRNGSFNQNCSWWLNQPISLKILYSQIGFIFSNFRGEH